jgi:hypothetical protein
MGLGNIAGKVSGKWATAKWISEQILMSNRESIGIWNSELQEAGWIKIEPGLGNSPIVTVLNGLGIAVTKWGLADKKPQQEFPIAVPMRTPSCHPSVTAADTQQASSCHPSVTAKEVSTSKEESNGPPREAWKVEKELKAVREEIARTRDDPPSATRKELLRGLNKREAKLRQEFAACA